MATSSSIDSSRNKAEKKDVCPLCNGIGYLRYDVPVNDPRFGKMEVCECQLRKDKKNERERLVKVSHLESVKHMTFDSFKTQGRMGLGEQQIHSLNAALNQAKTYANQLSGWLLFIGGYGCGKTHLAAGIANHAVDLGVPTLFQTVPDLLDWIRFSYNDPSSTFESRFAEIRGVTLLVLDDIGTQNATAWAEEKLYQIINHRYLNKLATIVTSNVELVELDGRIRSRLMDPDLVTHVRIMAPDYRSPLQDSTHASISTLSIVCEHSFGNFSMRENEKLPAGEQKSLEKAFRASQNYAEHPKGWLVLQGTYGCGKTHLAAAIGNYRDATGEQVIFQVVPDLLDHLRATFNPASNISYDSLFEQIRTAPLLILDDLGTQSSTPWAKEKLFQLLNYRYETRLPTVITTTASLDEMDPRIRSRMLDTSRCTVHAILAPSYRSGQGSSVKSKRP